MLVIVAKVSGEDCVRLLSPAVFGIWNHLPKSCFRRYSLKSAPSIPGHYLKRTDARDSNQEGIVNYQLLLLAEVSFNDIPYFCSSC
ncbi:hypothetical protein CEXT_438841 [Caerostris extrusa]|uniref:Uncharacterized protein n=1 Tax=Caerostris extrusa TaxID=172846 RepID=A0AAV4VDZ2_CAEEX|nr:hypothetical protein CEXT_438841 [Caerostris extrusa]